MAETQRAETIDPTSHSVPKWVSGKVLPQAGTPVEGVQVLGDKAHKSAVIFARGRTYVAEKPLMRSPRIYEVYHPGNYVLAPIECPHCHEAIEAQFLRAGLTPRTNGDGDSAVAPATPAALEGKNYDIIEIEGIGETIAKRLEAVSIRTTTDLLASEPAKVAQAADVSPNVARKWFSMAELMHVKGIGKQFAELLVRSGITSIEELKKEKPGPLLRRVEQKQAEVGVKIQGARLNEKRVGEWIREAKGMGRVRQS